MTLTVKQVTGGYGQVPVLKDISFDVNNGELVGLIGLNGAGKSTTIKEIIGLLQPVKGTISVDGLRLSEDAQAYRKKIGFIPETPVLYEELTLREHIEVTAMAYDIPKEVAFQRAEKLLTTFRLEKRLEWFPANFSKGMKQKVMILCAFLVEPSLYIIDEPFLGLGGYGGTDTLTSIGTNSPTVDITLPYNQGVAHITYNSVSVVDNNSGSFNVVFDEQVGIDDDQTIFNKTVNNSSSIVQLL